jgi:hypothetical protein
MAAATLRMYGLFYFRSDFPTTGALSVDRHYSLHVPVAALALQVEQRTAGAGWLDSGDLA